MISYIENLRELVSDQVNNLIIGHMRQQKVYYGDRRTELMEDIKYCKDDGTWHTFPESPKNNTTSDDIETNGLLQKKDANGTTLVVHTNNNPDYPINMIDLFNTPFDHIGRILLQDLSRIMFTDSDNYFRQVFSTIDFIQDGHSEVNSIQMSQQYSPDGRSDILINYNHVNSVLKSGRFFIDSFTYTPFIDYCREYPGKVGIYSDEFLNRYNSGWYDISYNQVDTHRNRISRELYKLRNLEDDIELAKIEFRRDVLTSTDKKVYIYNLCEHLAKLFAKLSNIRMSHVFYGFKSPHHHWEGILALDIWYQMLYMKIDSQMNSSSDNIRSNRSDYVTPRGVLDRIVTIIKQPESFDNIKQDDFKWFSQPGQIYSTDKSMFTIYSNLHIGRSYDVMTPMEYHELSGDDESVITDSNGNIVEYIKPTPIPDNTDLYQKMVSNGYNALMDAFECIKNEGILNIYNSNINCVEEYSTSNKSNYSQGQCAIVIERIFSRLYKYLQFKSTTSETFTKHINIDQGYKYLDSQTIAESDNENSGLYYSDSQPYFGYVNKLIEYARPTDGSQVLNVLDSDEKDILGKMIDILSFERSKFLSDEWDLCPLCVKVDKSNSTPPTCKYASTDGNVDGVVYCKFSGIPPRSEYEVDNQKMATQTIIYGDEQDTRRDYDPSFVNVSCPKVNAWLRKSIENNDFDVGTIIDASDLDVLLRALLKVNIDIAHREYYLKIEIPNDTDWWYGYIWGDDYIVCNDSDSVEEENDICDEEYDNDKIICKDEVGIKWISFEPTIEYKFSNTHELNQVTDGKLLCTSSLQFQTPRVIPVNRELLDDFGIHYSDVMYFYDYFKSISDQIVTDGISANLSGINDAQAYYDICPMSTYFPTNIQLQTFTAIMKKYRPVIMPRVRDIFNETINDKTKYQVDIDNDYGIFGWCTIPSKAMVDIQYNEDSLIVPSSYEVKFQQQDSVLMYITMTQPFDVELPSDVELK